jgi:hypothetical protein
MTARIHTSSPMRLSEFRRSLSYREFITPICLVLFYFAFSIAVDLYRDEPFFLGRTSMFKYLLIAMLMIIQHVFYKVDHKRSNTMLGRSICDYGFLIALTTISWILSFFGLHQAPTVNSFDAGIVLVIALTIMIAFFELGVALLKRLLALLKWQIL